MVSRVRHLMPMENCSDHGWRIEPICAPFFVRAFAEVRSGSFFRRFTTGLESCAKTQYQMLLINWFAKLRDHPIVQGTSPVYVIRIGIHEDCGIREACL